MLFLGSMADGSDPLTSPGNHSPRATFDDRVLPDGAAFYATFAARRLTP
jgi:hippurate hydrolase